MARKRQIPDQSLIIKKLKDQNARLEQENEKLKSDSGIAAYELKLEKAYDKKLEQAARNNKKLLTDQEKLHKKELKEKDQEIRVLKEQAKELTAQLENEKRENQKLREEADKKQAEFEKICKDYFESQLGLYRQIDSLNDELKNVTKRIRTLETKKKNAESGLEKKKKEAQTVKQSLKDLEFKTRHLESEKKKLENSLASLTARVNQNSRNSSIPSSQDPNHKKIPNSRVKTGKKPGAQPGHKGHGRTQLVYDQTVTLDPPECVQANPDAYIRVENKEKIHTEAQAYLHVNVTGFKSECWRLKDPEAYRQSGYQQIWSPFPKNLQNEMNYGASIKSLCLMLTQDMNVSTAKAGELISTLSNGKIQPSTGWINQLTTEFENKSKPEIQQIWSDLLSGKFMHTDATFLRLDGDMAYACICSNGKSTLYQGRLHKGSEMVKGTPIEQFKGIIISDREAIFVNTEDNDHQICLVHIDRDLTGIMENEPDKKWAGFMKKFLKAVVKKYGTKGASEEEVKKITEEFYKIIEDGLKEYPEKPANYVKGYNLIHSLQKLQDEKGAVLYFVSHEGVPSNNNTAERGARSLKRKVKQADGFRSVRGLNGTCAVKSVLDTYRAQGVNKFDLCKKIMERQA